MRFRGSKRKVGAPRVKGDGFIAYFGGRGWRGGECGGGGVFEASAGDC